MIDIIDLNRMSNEEIRNYIVELENNRDKLQEKFSIALNKMIEKSKTIRVQLIPFTVEYGEYNSLKNEIDYYSRRIFSLNSMLPRDYDLEIMECCRKLEIKEEI